MHLPKSKSAEFLSAYSKLKLLVVNNRFRPGEQLQACTLADGMAAGITPVREALIRLAAEDVITCYPKRGYFAKVVNNSELAELYALAHSLLRSILQWGQSRPSTAIAAADVAPAGGQTQRDPIVLALTLEQLHEQIAILHGGAEVAKVIRNYNCRTHAVRMIYVEQAQAYECVADYIRSLVALLAANDREAVAAKITEHFEAKVDQVHTLVKEVTAQAFSRECRDSRLETITQLARPVLGSALLSTARLEALQA